MKVLMFGWEYPPHVYGGLATANYGITEGLHAQGDMDITLCLPKPFGDEDRTAANERIKRHEEADVAPAHSESPEATPTAKNVRAAQAAHPVQDAHTEAELPPSGEVETEAGHTDAIEGPTEHLDMSAILPTHE